MLVWLRRCHVVVLAMALAAGAADGEVLRSIQEVRRLTKVEADEGRRVELNGIVTLAMPGENGSFVLDDGTGHGIYVQRSRTDLPPGELEGALSAGMRVELEGRTVNGRFARDVIPSRIRRTGTSPLPPALPVRMEDLLGGHLDCRRVRVRGVVQSHEVRPRPPNVRLMLGMAGGGKLPLLVMNISAEESRALVDAEVEAEGVATSFFNERGEWVGVNLEVDGADSLKVFNAPLAKDELPLLPLVDLKQFSPDPLPPRRVKVRGVVTFSWPGRFFYAQDGERAVRVTARSGGNVSPGDQVEILGYPETQRAFAEITGAEVAVIGREPVPAALAANRDRILRQWTVEGITGGMDGRRVVIDARLDKVESESKDALRLYLAHEGATLVAILQAGEETRSSLEIGGTMRLTGICVIDLVGSWPSAAMAAPRDFQLLVQSPRDIEVTGHPMWWTPRKFWTALASVASAALLAGIWVVVLKRQVRRQTGIIKNQSIRETLAEERSRLAREFHDTLEQELTGVSIQLDTAMDAVKHSPPHALEALEHAHTLLSYTRTEARRSIWDLRAMALQEYGLFGALEWSAGQLRGSGAPEITLELMGTPFPLDIQVETHLLRIGSESMTNSVKHARASVVVLTLSYAPDGVELTVRDDGTGFSEESAPDAGTGHFGLRGMRERANRIGADLTVRSGTDGGTLVVVALDTDQRKSL